MEQGMKPRNMLIASAVAVTMLAAGCSSGGSGGGTTGLKLEKTNITVNAFPAIDSAGLYIAQDQGLFAAQGLHVTIVPVPKGPPPSTQDLIKGQVEGKWDISAGDYVTYIENQLGAGMPKIDLRLVAEASFLQPNVLTLMVSGGSAISQVSQLKGKVVSVNAKNDIGTLLIDSLLVSHGLKPQQINYTEVPFPGVVAALSAKNSQLAAAFAPEPFVSGGESVGLQELADLDQGSSQDFPIQGYAVTADWAKKYPNTLKAFTTALSQGQQVADTDRAAVEKALQKYLGIPSQPAAFISLPAFPLGMDAVRLQRVVSAMIRFRLLPENTKFQISSMLDG
jgi:NitT/TauT family transport system substrate-binding protein